ncbi:MAG: hypothetical protein ACOYU4_10495 [Thermodesulfobacteriota bacterium]
MKIKETAIHPAGEAGRLHSRKKAEGMSFRDVFSKVAGKADQAPGSAGLNNAAPLYSIDALAALGTDTRLQGVARAEELIALLDQYRMALADPKKTLKDAGILLNSAGEKVRQLDPVIQGLPSDDPLKRLLNETGVIIAVETIKFNRGDYI